MMDAARAQGIHFILKVLKKLVLRRSSSACFMSQVETVVSRGGMPPSHQIQALLSSLVLDILQPGTDKVRSK